MITEPVLNLLLFCELWGKEEDLPVSYIFYRMAFATRSNIGEKRPLLALAPLAWYTDIDGKSPIGNRKETKDERIELFHDAVDFIITSRGQSPESCSQILNKLVTEAFSCMAIEKDRFCKWCLSSGYKLPNFWFNEEERNKAVGQKLVDIRHSKSRPSAAAIKEIVSIIKKKKMHGEYWHQSNEIRFWLEKHPESKTTASRLTKEVNKELNNAGIPPLQNAPRKK